jgi:hypothetical protein
MINLAGGRPFWTQQWIFWFHGGGYFLTCWVTISFQISLIHVKSHILQIYHSIMFINVTWVRKLDWHEDRY